jgi:hypothetical protein
VEYVTVRPLAFQSAPTRAQSIADDMNDVTRDAHDRYPESGRTIGRQK